jgi:DNA invertase Pin-like site-specific DNA recombinase
MTKGTSVVGYARVSTNKQGDSGLGLETQRQAITREAKHRGWELVTIEEDVESGKSTKHRPGLRRALSYVESGEAEALLVAKLDRLSRSLLDFAGLIQRAQGYGWRLVALDLGVDTGTAQGKLMANVLTSFGQYEREIIGQRTKDALAVARANGKTLGRPVATDPKTRARIRRLRTNGWSYRRIADKLNAEHVPTAQGGARWYASTVKRLSG